MVHDLYFPFPEKYRTQQKMFHIKCYHFYCLPTSGVSMRQCHFWGVAYLKVSWNTLLILILRPEIIDVYNRRINIIKTLTPYFFSTNSTNWSVVKSPPNSLVISVSNSWIMFIAWSEFNHPLQSVFWRFLRDFCFSATYSGQKVYIMII